MKVFTCKECGSIDLRIEAKGGNNMLYCNDCGVYVQNVSKNDLPLVRKQLAENIEKPRSEQQIPDEMTLVDDILAFCKEKKEYYELLFCMAKEQDEQLAQGVYMSQSATFTEVILHIRNMLTRNTSN